MLQYILIALIILWLLGFAPFGFLHVPLFTLGIHPFTLQNLIILLLIIVLIKYLPTKFRTIVTVLLILWLLSLLGFFVWLSNIVFLLLIIAILFYIF